MTAHAMCLSKSVELGQGLDKVFKLLSVGYSVAMMLDNSVLGSKYWYTPYSFSSSKPLDISRPDLDMTWFQLYGTSLYEHHTDAIPQQFNAFLSCRISRFISGITLSDGVFSFTDFRSILKSVHGPTNSARRTLQQKTITANITS